ncbi:hypothetical protein [Rhodoferax bucti]|uniref:hypothetical protein n=1 Tax=Rhodoferax bucti TaxID=2576305 RepID=UPI00110836A9|nr:hypothetical protein [Rhodoferax bucti]
MSSAAFEGLLSSVQHMNHQKARHRQARHENMVQAGEDLVFNTLLECLPEDHPMRQQAVRDHISQLARQAHVEGRTPGKVDPESILTELLQKHQRAVDRAAEELEDQQPQMKGLVFRHFEIRVRREPMRLSGVTSLEEAQNVRLRAAKIVRNTQFNTPVDAAAAVRRAMGAR